MKKEIYLSAIKTAHSKMRELKKKEEEVLIKEFSFDYPQIILLQGKSCEASKVVIYLHYVLDIFEIKIILDEEVVTLNMSDPIPVLESLEENRILPSPKEFGDILPLRGMAFAEYVGCDG
jgi:hypothetical protein